jgi:predicted Fe-Mo cluster-binding NifX family protein
MAVAKTDFMIIAIPVWNSRVSPVFDVAKTVRIAHLDDRGGELIADGTHVLSSARPEAVLSEVGVDVLVCSAISAPLEAAICGLGIEVISDICGSPDEIISAIAAGDTELARFRSPGSKCKPKRLAAMRIAHGGGGPGRSA